VYVGGASPYPRLGGEGAHTEPKEAFAQHVCTQHPRERKTREDVKRAVARVVNISVRESPQAYRAGEYVHLFGEGLRNNIDSMRMAHLIAFQIRNQSARGS
jgi:hypothetical protein